MFDGRGPVHLAASVCFHSVPMMVITLLQAVSLLLAYSRLKVHVAQHAIR